MSKFIFFVVRYATHCCYVEGALGVATCIRVSRHTTLRPIPKWWHCFASNAVRWGKLLRPEKGDPSPDLFIPSGDFAFILVTGREDQLPPKARARFAVIHIRDGETTNGGSQEAQDDQALASLFGAAEVKRNSLQMVEAAFDGYAPIGKEI